MRYWHTKLKGLRDGNLWRESDKDDPVEIINDWYYANEIVYDCDYCGDDSARWVFDNGETYIIEYSWSASHDSDGEFMVDNEHDIRRYEEDFDYPGDRDWLTY